MAARVDRSGPPAVDREDGELNETTQLQLVGDIRAVERSQPLYPDGYRLEAKTRDNGDRELSVYSVGKSDPESGELVYRLDVLEVDGTFEFRFSDESNLTRFSLLNESGADWFRGLIAEGFRKQPKGRGRR